MSVYTSFCRSIVFVCFFLVPSLISKVRAGSDQDGSRGAPLSRWSRGQTCNDFFGGNPPKMGQRNRERKIKWIYDICRYIVVAVTVVKCIFLVVVCVFGLLLETTFLTAFHSDPSSIPPIPMLPMGSWRDTTPWYAMIFLDSLSF